MVIIILNYTEMSTSRRQLIRSSYSVLYCINSVQCPLATVAMVTIFTQPIRSFYTHHVKLVHNYILNQFSYVYVVVEWSIACGDHIGLSLPVLQL